MPLGEGPTNPDVQGGGDPRFSPFRIISTRSGCADSISRRASCVSPPDPLSTMKTRSPAGGSPRGREDGAADLESDDDAGHLRGPERERYDGSGVHDGLSGWFAYATTGGNRGATVGKTRGPDATGDRHDLYGTISGKE